MPERRRSSTAINTLTIGFIKTFIADAKAARPGIKKVSDGNGLFLVVQNRNPVWRLKYFLGKEKSYTLGDYPAMSLDEARQLRGELRKAIVEGKDPVLARRLRRASAIESADRTFASAMEVWLAKKAKEWKESHFYRAKQALERDVIPYIGHLPVSAIEPIMITSVVKRIEGRGVIDTTYKILQHVNGIFRHAKAMGWCKDNPAFEIKEVLPRRKAVIGMPAILNFSGLGDILRRADAARLSPAVRLAHRLTAFTAARMGNVTLAQWSEFHLDAEQPVWVIPRAKMKAHDRQRDHVIVLSRPIAQELRAWRSIAKGEGYVFQTPTQVGKGRKPISREAVEKAYRSTLELKDKHTPHGWRAAFSTLAKDKGFARDVVELALDHLHDNDVVLAYDRGERMAERINLMNWWGEQLVNAQRGGDLIEFPNRMIA